MNLYVRFTLTHQLMYILSKGTLNYCLNQRINKIQVRNQFLFLWFLHIRKFVFVPPHTGVVPCSFHDLTVLAPCSFHAVSVLAPCSFHALAVLAPF
jgi:hypothetical protein